MNRRKFMGGLFKAALALNMEFGRLAPIVSKIVEEQAVGLEIRFVRTFDVTQNKMVTRWHTLYGFGLVTEDGKVQLG